MHGVSPATSQGICSAHSWHTKLLNANGRISAQEVHRNANVVRKKVSSVNIFPYINRGFPVEEPLPRSHPKVPCHCTGIPLRRLDRFQRRLCLGRKEGIRIKNTLQGRLLYRKAIGRINTMFRPKFLRKDTHNNPRSPLRHIWARATLTPTSRVSPTVKLHNPS